MDDAVLDILGLASRGRDEISPFEIKNKLKASLDLQEAKPPTREGTLLKNVAILGNAIGLDSAQREILYFAIAVERTLALSEMLLAVFRGSTISQMAQVIAVACDMQENLVRRCLTRNSVLIESGLVRLKGEPNEFPFSIQEGVAEQVLEEHQVAETLFGNCFTRAKTSKLTMADFEHIGEDLTILHDYLKTATQRKQPGVNIMLFGAPGVGKTELARVVSEAIGATLYEVLVEDDGGRARSPVQRLDSYRLCQNLLMRYEVPLVLFDEVEDVFPVEMQTFFGPVRRSHGDKGWIVSLLEKNPVPTIWIANEISQIDDAYLRRFDLCLEVRVPPQAKRKQLLSNAFSILEVGKTWVERMSKAEHLTPADVDKAVKVLKGMERAGSAAENERLSERILQNNLAARRASIEPAHVSVHEAQYDLSCLNTDHDILTIASCLSTKLKGSVLLYGPPGTGKTAFAFHLGEIAQKPVLVRRASDLLNKYVGGTEQNIAAMFSKARSEQAILLLDEADGFFRDRRGAHQSWEVTQVNELLVQMEAFPGLFICSTNLMEDLDQAAFRRFALKIRFDYMTYDQRLKLFTAHAFTMGLDGLMDEKTTATMLEDMKRLDRLTPGDFATVRRKNDLLGNIRDVGAFVKALEAECNVKPGVHEPQKVGF